MASDRQIAANRRNAQRSTGPRTEEGKRRSRRNAFRHGLTAESVITVLEDEAAYRRFENALIADYAPDTTTERRLVIRMASLLWRLRRATAIESGLFQIQGQIIRDQSQGKHLDNRNSAALKLFRDFLAKYQRGQMQDELVRDDRPAIEHSPSRATTSVDLAVCFLRLENFSNGMLDTIGRYETRLWRQLAQTILVLDAMRAPRRRRQQRLIRHSQYSILTSRAFSGS